VFSIFKMERTVKDVYRTLIYRYAIKLKMQNKCYRNRLTEQVMKIDRYSRYVL